MSQFQADTYNSITPPTISFKDVKIKELEEHVMKLENKVKELQEETKEVDDEVTRNRWLTTTSTESLKLISCKYYLPCGRCDLTKELCNDAAKLESM